jgi:hypothetical protein
VWRVTDDPRAAVCVGLAPVMKAFAERFQKQHVLFSEHERYPASIASCTSGTAVVEFNHISERART